VAQALWDRDLLRSGTRGLGFAVGHEPMPALFAKYGCEIVATDQLLEEAVKQGWSQSGQHTGKLAELERPAICAPEQFYQRVSYSNVNMNDIPADLTDFDFCWSICSFEHLGSLEHGMKFVENAMNTLRSGGVAIHTTEFNLSSDLETIESENLSIYRRRDIDELTRRLSTAGYHVAPLDLEPRKGFVETVVDLPPYRHSPHIRLRIEKYDCTSVGIIVTKP
jgi:SAM-dependent methyltransferase